MTGIDDRSFAAAQDFLLASKMYWTKTLTPALRAEIEHAAAGRPLDTANRIAAVADELPLYRAFAWLERHLQRFKYSGRYGLLPYHVQDRAALEAALAAELPPDLLQLDPDLPLPTYYTSVDIHQHPGGVWSDEIAGWIYERGARTTTPTLGAAHEDLHDRFARLFDVLSPRQILDVGCGFGKSTRPIYARCRDAHVTGIDFSAPVLKLAAHDAARAQARNVRFRQANGEGTDFADESFDVVTSTMLLHEMPPPALSRLFAETWRLLEPGGTMLHLDFHAMPDLFRRFLHYGHSRRNNEPYMRPFAEMDLEVELGRVGFTDVTVEPFAETDGALDAGNTAWRFPWTVIRARKAA